MRYELIKQTPSLEVVVRTGDPEKEKITGGYSSRSVVLNHGHGNISDADFAAIKDNEIIQGLVAEGYLNFPDTKELPVHFASMIKERKERERLLYGEQEERKSAATPDVAALMETVAKQSSALEAALGRIAELESTSVKKGEPRGTLAINAPRAQ